MDTQEARDEMSREISVAFSGIDPTAIASIRDALWAAGYRKHSEPEREYAVARESWPSVPVFRMRDRASAERHVANPPLGETPKGWLAIQRDVIKPTSWVRVGQGE